MNKQVFSKSGKKYAGAAMVAVACLLASLAMPGCAVDDKAGPYETASQVFEYNNKLNGCLEGTTGFLDAVSSIDLEGNQDVFTGLTDSLESSRAAVEEAGLILDEIENVEFADGTEEIEEELGAYTEEVRIALDEILAVLDYIKRLDENLDPLREVRKEVSEMEIVEIRDDYTIAIERADIILNTRTEVIAGIQAVDAPTSMLHFKQAITVKVEEFYDNIEAFVIEASTGIVSGSENEGTGKPTGSQMYKMAMEELPEQLKVNHLNEKVSRLDEILFDYLIEYRPEQEE